MDETSDLSKKRLGYLRALYEESQADEYKVLRTYEIAGNRAYERTLTDKIVRYLEREGLVELGSTGSQICITHAGIREVEQELAAMLGEMLVFMAQAVKDVFSADEVAEALQVRESEVTRLYRQARDQGWVKKFSDKPAMFRLTGSGAQQASRVLANRAVSSAGAYPGAGASAAMSPGRALFRGQRMAFDDLNEKPKEFIIAILEELNRGGYPSDSLLGTVHNDIKGKWSLTLGNRPIDLAAPVDEAILVELQETGYLRLTEQKGPNVKLYSLTKKGRDEYKMHVQPPVDNQVVSEGPDFSFIANPDLRPIIERDYEEILRCLGAKAYKAATVMCGSVMEALLLDALLADEPKAKQSAEALTDKGGKVPKDLGKWSLRLMIAVAQDLQILPAAILGMSDPIREYRNLIHPAVEMRKKIAPEREEARAAQTALDVIIKNLARAQCRQCKSA